MRNGCLPNIRNISLWRKSEKVEMADGETKEVSRQSHEKRVTEEIRIREYVDGKSQINDSSTSINDGSLLGKEVIHAKPRDSSAENKISTHAKQASTQDQANTRKEYKRGTHVSHNILTVVEIKLMLSRAMTVYINMHIE